MDIQWNQGMCLLNKLANYTSARTKDSHSGFRSFKAKIFLNTNEQCPKSQRNILC